MDDTTRLWAQYTPFYSTESESVKSEGKPLSNEIPQGCQVDFVQMISRHGARYPTIGKGTEYKSLMHRLQNKATFSGKAKFLKDYKYKLKEESLVPFGEQEMVNAGIRFHERYPDLSSDNEPFIRSTDSERVMKSAQKFVEGFQTARGRSTKGANVPKIGTILFNKPGNPNTLNHKTCDKFEETFRELKHEGMDGYLENVMMPTIRPAIETMIKGVDLTDRDIYHLMELCSFETVAATPKADKKSPFCDMFKDGDWKHYDYVQSLGKFYAFGHGNLLGPTQGIGFLNELVSRLTGEEVKDETCVNHKLAKDPKTFPRDRALYFDFGHDNGMIPIYSAMGLFKKKLSKTEYQTAADSGGFSLGQVVPFAARGYIERMTCCNEDDTSVDETEEKGKHDESWIRLIINERVVRLPKCKHDELGRCRQKDFIDGTLEWARSNGNWKKDCPSTKKQPA